MMVSGKEINFFIKGKEVPERYYTILKSEIRNILKNLDFIKDTKIKQSKSTDSMYFVVTMKHTKTIYTISLRSHPPSTKQENYLYYYVPNFLTITKMGKKIMEDLIILYNQNVKDLGLCYKNNDRQQNYQIKPKKLKSKSKGNKTHALEVQQDSFERFLNDFKKR